MFPLEIIFVIYKIHLHTSRLYGSDFYNQGMIRVVDYQIHTG